MSNFNENPSNNTGGVRFKTGVVAAAKVGFAKVQFKDLDDLISSWLPVVFAKTHLDKMCWTLDVGEHVQCVMDGNMEEGYIAGAIYSDADTPPVTSGDKMHIRFADGGLVEYDRGTGKMTVVATGEVDLTAGGTVLVTAPKVRMVTPRLEVTGEIIDRCDSTGRTMSNMRTIYNDHTHNDPQGGSVTVPNLSM